MPAPTVPAPGDTASSVAATCSRYESDWQSWRASYPRVEAYLDQTEEPARSLLLAELVRREMAHRGLIGETLSREEYYRRFPREPWLEALLTHGGGAPERIAPQPTSLASMVPGHGGDRTIPPEEPQGGRTLLAGVQPLPGYELLEELGRGGMGVVYKARQVRLSRIVAVKIMLAGRHADRAALERFRTEAQAIARLQHPYIVQIHEVGEHEGLPYLTLEYCAGGSLDQKLRQGALAPVETAVLVEKLARAIQAAHEARVLHRDLKPANVLLAEDGTPKITDFGLAKKLGEVGQTQTGAVMGTPSYMAPEQAEGKKDVGPAVDVYALGAILYECLTGRPPFQAGTTLDTLLLVASEDPTPPREINARVPIELEAICLKCLHKEPSNRYESARALAEDLERFLRGEPVQAKSLSFARRVARLLERSYMDNELLDWSSLLFYFAAVILVIQLLFFWEQRARQGLPALAATRAAQVVLMLGGYLWFRRGHWTPRTQAERQLGSIWIGNLLACSVAAFGHRLLFGWDGTSPVVLYQMWTAFAGAGFFAMGNMYWGGCYAIGVAFFVLAMLMPFHPEWAPLSFGLAWAVVLLGTGLRLRALARKG